MDTLNLPRSAKSVMMSAHALCPTDLPHPERMQWMAEYFMKHLGARQCEYALGICTRQVCADRCQAKAIASAIRGSSPDKGG